MKNKIIIAVVTLLMCGTGWAAATPQGSRYDNRMQQVSYNARNTTVVYAANSSLSTLVFDNDEQVISVKRGFPRGWLVEAEENRVYIRPAPVKQPVATANEDGEQTEAEQVFEPKDKDWRSNLFITTTKRFYSVELRLVDDPAKLSQVAYVVNYTYPLEERTKAAAQQLARQQEWQRQQTQKQISQVLANAKAPRNWQYFMRVAKNSDQIAPDFAYDDGRFTYLGFSPNKRFPAPFQEINGKEQVADFSVEQKGNYKVMVIRRINPRFVLRHDNAVVGIENKGYGKVTINDGKTVSPQVERQEVNNE